jgi:hypothetical protein
MDLLALIEAISLLIWSGGSVALYVAFYNFSRVHETLRTTPAVALGITDHVWSFSELIDAALSAVPPKPTPTPAQRRRTFRVIQGDLFDWEG